MSILEDRNNILQMTIYFVKSSNEKTLQELILHDDINIRIIFSQKSFYCSIKINDQYIV